LLRPTEPLRLVGNAAKAEKELGWKPQVQFPELIALMVAAEQAELSQA
jgi:GDPmannose 4,6-dehydratase